MNESDSSTTRIVRLRNRRSFLEHFSHEGVLGSIFVPGLSHADLGDGVRLGLFFEEEQRTFRIRGLVRSKRTTATKDAPIGMFVELLPSECHVRDLLLDFAQGRVIDWVERDARFPAQLQIHYATGSVFLSDVTEDLSQGGVFLRTHEALHVGERLRLKLKLPGEFFSVRLGGEVVWVRTDPPGVGIRFTFDDEGSRARLQRIVDELRAQIDHGLETHEVVR